MSVRKIYRRIDSRAALEFITLSLTLINYSLCEFCKQHIAQGLDAAVVCSSGGAADLDVFSLRRIFARFGNCARSGQKSAVAGEGDQSGLLCRGFAAGAGDPDDRSRAVPVGRNADRKKTRILKRPERAFWRSGCSAYARVRRDGQKKPFRIPKRLSLRWCTAYCSPSCQRV